MTVHRTITSIFMVPTLKIPKDKLLANGFINGYSTDKKRDIQYVDSVYVLFRPKDLYKFREFLDSEYERTKSVIDDYDYQDGFVVVVYKLDPRFKIDFDLVRQSKYSKTSEKFQKLFTEKVTITMDGSTREEVSLQCRIFRRAKDLLEFWENKLETTFGDDIEVWHGFDEEKETLDIEKLKEHADSN